MEQSCQNLFYEQQDQLYDNESKKQQIQSSHPEQCQQKPILPSYLSTTQKYKQWQFCQQYINFFNSTQISSIHSNKILTHQTDFLSIKLQLQNLLKTNNFVLMNNVKDTSFFTPNQIQIKIISSTKYLNVTQILCQLGPFAKGYTVLNQKNQSPRHCNRLISFGGFGKIYSCQEKKTQNQTVVKCLEFNRKTQHNLKYFIKQYFICDIMSSLRAGPQVVRAKGFDLILFQGCLEFQMQKCSPFIEDTVEADIKQSLLKMHIMNVTHCDIKPSNIMYSKFFGKNVLIDFGISDILNQQWGQKALVSFRGTYEYCGPEMKELFMKNDTKLVDLYKNDIFQLNNSLKCIYLENNDQNLSQQSSSTLTIPYETLKFIVEQKQAIFLVKYHLYANQYRSHPETVSQNFFRQINKIKDQAILYKLLIQSIEFCLHLEKQSLHHIRQYMIAKCQKIKHMNTSISQISIQDIAKMDMSQVQSTFVDKVYFQKLVKLYSRLQTDKYSQNSQNLQQQFQWILRDKKNFNEVLANPKKFNKLQTYQKYEVFLKYCSFWRSSFSTTIEQKQLFAQNFAQHLKINAQKSQIKYYSRQYLPQLQFVKVKCPNIVLVCAFLLTECMQGQFNRFKQKYMTTILKDCLILGFQYYLFLTDVMNFYYEGLITKRNKLLISFLVIETSELYFLTNNHFLWTSCQQTYFQHKLKKYTLKENLHRMIQLFKVKVQKSEKYMRKLRPLQVYWTTLMSMKKLMNEPHMYLNHQEPDIKILIDQICYQFSCLSIIQSGQTFPLSIAYFYQILIGQQADEPKLKAEGKISDSEIIAVNAFNLRVLLCPLRTYPDFQVRENILKFDHKIHCQELSNKFCIELRYRVAQTYPNKEQIMRIINMIVQFPGCPSFNYASILRINPSFHVISKTFITPQLESEFLSSYKLIITKMHSIHRSFVSFFKEYSYFLNMCLIYWDNLNKNNQDQRLAQETYHKENMEFIECIVKETHSETSQIYMLNFLLETYKWYSLQYLTACYKFFNLCKNTIVSNQDFSQSNKNNKHNIQLDTQYDSEKQVIYIYFGSQIFKCYLMYDQFIKYWQMFIIKMALDKATTVQHQFKKLCNAFIMKQKINYLAQIIVIVCSQRDVFKDGIGYFNGFFEHFDFILSHEQILPQLYVELIKYCQAFKELLPLPVNILPLYCCILQFRTQIQTDIVGWKTILMSVCLAFQRTTEIKVLKKDVVCVYRMKIHEYLLQFMKAKKLKKKRKMFLIRKVAKNLCEVNPYLLNGVKQYGQMQLQLSGLLNGRQKRMEIIKQHMDKLSKLNEKIKNLVQNLSLKRLNLNQQHSQKITRNHKLKRNLIKQHEIQLRFMDQFKLKELNLSDRYKITPKYITLVENQTLIPEKRFEEGMMTIRGQVQQLKMSAQFPLSQSIYELVGQIIKEEKRGLVQQFQTVQNISVEQFYQSTEKYIFNSKAVSRPKQVKLTLSVV